jgi:hypothetical protein
MEAKAFIELIKENMQNQLDQRFNEGDAVAIMAGPSVVIEVIVRKVSADTGVELDWGYSGGRAGIYVLPSATKEQILKVKSGLFCAIPQSNLTQLDI